MKIETPTGHVLIVNGERGKLECLSLADYGQEKNVKAAFLGLDRPINGVPHGELLPLTKKWVVTISSQYGCDQYCTFCDVPRVGRGINASMYDMIYQVKEVLQLHPDLEHTERLNLHFARMGEPTLNPAVITTAMALTTLEGEFCDEFHPVVSTSMPAKNPELDSFIASWLMFKNSDLLKDAGLQLSINTTDAAIRKRQMPNSLSLAGIAKVMDGMPEPTGRKITLNFALTDAAIDAELLASFFDPEFYMCKITPMHMTRACEKWNIRTNSGFVSFQPYEEVEENLRDAGFDVLVFIPSIEEDSSRITCGNAILSDR